MLPAHKVSIGVPVYNGENFIREALESLLNQSFTDFEVIISDNCSIDQTENICKEYANQDKRIKYIRQIENIGPTKNFKFVLQESRGEYFSWLAHDDILEKEFIYECSSFLDKNINCIAVSGFFSTIANKENKYLEKKLPEIDSHIDWKSKANIFYRYPMGNSFFCIYGMFRRKYLLDAIEDTQYGPLMTASELPILAQVANRGEISSIPIFLRKYRFHAESTFHQEQLKLSKNPTRKKILEIYNILWNRVYQIRTLMKSNYKWKFKIKIMKDIFYFYASLAGSKFKRIIGKIK